MNSIKEILKIKTEKAGKKLKKNFIITVNNFMRKTVVVLIFIAVVVLLYNFGVIKNTFNAMAREAVFLDSMNDFSDMLIPKNSTAICMLTNSGEYSANKNNKNSVATQEENVIKNEDGDIESENTENEPYNVDFSKEKSSISVVNNNIIVSNAANKSFDIDNILSLPLQFKKTDGYKALIIHTHTTESYMPDDRNDDPKKNITRVGEEFAKVLNEKGIKTLHEKTVHDVPYSKSYINELKSIENILAQHPSIEVIIDVHRDALYNSNNEKIKPVTVINGKKVAQVMLVCGTDAMGLPHDNWKSCFSFALKVQNDMNKNYPNFARPVNLREERFNTHMSANSVIFEIGANGNTLQEAVFAGHYAALSIANVLNGKN